LTLAPWLLLFAVAVFTWSRSLAQFARRFEGSSSFGSAAAVLCQFAISVYGGYFGGGMGLLMLALFSAIRGNTFHSANGLRTICGSAINGVAVVIFLIHDAIDWRVLKTTPFGLVHHPPAPKIDVSRGLTTRAHRV